MGILAELRRRRLFRVAALYVVGAWMVLQVFDLLFPRLGIPDAVMDLAFIGALLGFPVALVFGWIYDITPQGIVRTRPAGEEDGRPDLSLKRSDYLILTALLAVVAAIIYNLAIEVTELPPEGEDLLAPLEAPENSIAVLPFANMSNDPGNDYFCDGITEEILNKLAAMGDLHVIARTSSFALKDSGFDIRKMATLLGVRYLLQGSVRRDGNQLRISTQLLDRDGQQLWNTSFDREMEGVFAIQRDIADSVAVTITPQIVTQADTRYIPDIEAYKHYLRGHDIYIKRVPRYQWDAADQFRKAIELDPEFAEPYAELATVLMLGAHWDEDYQLSVRQAQEAIDTALALDPNLASAHAAQGLMLSQQLDFAEAEPYLRRAIDLDPSLVNARNWLSGVLGSQNRDDEGMLELEYAARIDPLAPIINVNLSTIDLEEGRPEQARQRLLRLLQVPRPSHLAFLGMGSVYLETGRLADYLMNSKELALAFARSAGRPWVANVANGYIYLGMWQQAEKLYEFLEQQFDDVYQAKFSREFMYRRQGRFKEITRHYESVIESQGMIRSDLSFPFALNYGILLAMSGRHSEALDLLEETLQIDSGSNQCVEDREANDGCVVLAWSLLLEGDSDRSEAIRTKMEDYFLKRKSQGGLHMSSDLFTFAQAALLASDEEATLDRLQRAIDAGWRDYFLLLHDPRWDALRDHPRLQELMAFVKSEIDAQRFKLEPFEAEDDFPARIDAAIAEYQASAGDDGGESSKTSNGE